MRVLMTATRREGGRTFDRGREKAPWRHSQRSAAPGTHNIVVRSTIQDEDRPKSANGKEIIHSNKGNNTREATKAPTKRTLHLGGPTVSLMSPHPPHVPRDGRPVGIHGGAHLEGECRKNCRRDKTPPSLSKRDAEDVV